MSLAAAAAALIVALAAAAGARAASRELSQRLVPAAASAGALFEQYVVQTTSLRDYVLSGLPAALQSFGQANRQIPGLEAELSVLVHGYPVMRGQLAAVAAADKAWLARVAGPQLADAARGDFARARALQADVSFTRPYTLAVRARMTGLQAQITATQGAVTARLIGRQHILLGGLVAVCVLVAVIAAGGVVVVRRWLLNPFTALRRAADAVAAGHYDTPVPAVGPAELADLGHSTELMRARLVAALASAERAEQRFRRLFESSPDATLTIAADGSILMANAHAERMFGYGPGELPGQPVQILVPQAERGDLPARLGAAFADPAQRLTGHDLRRSAVRKDGREFPIEVSLSSLPDDQGTVASIAVRDISDRLAAEAERDRLRAEAEQARLEQRQQQSQRMESLGQLVGGVAHDFNNLLGVITGYTQFIAEQVSAVAADDDRLAPTLADVEQVSAAADRAVRLTRQLLTFARRDIVHPEVLDVNTVISGLEQLLRRTLGEHIDLIITPGPGLWPVEADRGQLEQVLVNLAVNARDAMPGGGKLTIDTANLDIDNTYAAGHPDLQPGRHVRLRVSDTGTGMDRETVARVFEPFYTTKPQGHGTGLGLATVYGIITQAAGHAHIYSEPGLGTTVTATLPATQAAPAAATPLAAAPAAGRGETILLTEDEHSLGQLTNRLLARNGYQVCAAAGAADALRQASDLGQPIDLLLTDVVMPEMLGNEVAARVRALRPGLPVLFMSGYAQPVLDTQGALDPGVDLLEKPFTETTLLTRVRQAIDNRGQPHQPTATDR